MKTCRFQGRRQSDGCITCKLDGSRRRVDRCNRYDCKRWNNTPWKAFLWWWRYSPVFCTWKENKEYWARRWKE